jgi:hypothetical protein
VPNENHQIKIEVNGITDVQYIHYLDMLC